MFRKFCPGFRQLLPFPDCPDREIVQLYLEVDVQLRFPKEGKCFELNFSLSTSESLIEFFKRRKMFELPKVLPWFQTSRMFPDRPDGGGAIYIFKKKRWTWGGEGVQLSIVNQSRHSPTVKSAAFLIKN